MKKTTIQTKTINTLHKNYIIGMLTLLMIGIMFRFDPIAQDQAYHAFADGRAFFGLKNFFDVISNLPFTILGIMGLCFIHKTYKQTEVFSMKREKLLWQVFFFGVTLVGFGSGYYHIDTNNASIVWDRLPITISFMSLFSLIIMERMNAKLGLILSPFLLITGVGTVFYWYYTELLNQGDLRAYVLIQLLPLALIPLMLWLFPARYTQTKYLVYSLGCYGIAKLLELLDKPIFVLGNIVSGHTLKHLVVALGIYMLLLYLKHRKSKVYSL